MLYWIALTQIIVYLVAIPIIRVLYYAVDISYAWPLAFTFLSTFIVAGVIHNIFFSKNKKNNNMINFQVSKFGALFLFIWIGLCLLISFKYELYNRRIGTENAAELFASLPLIALFAFRTLEIALPMLVSAFVIKYFNRYQLSLLDLCLLVILLTAFLFLGAASSRSATGIFLMTILVISQNTIPSRSLSKVVGFFSVFGLIFFFLVTAFRMSSDTGRDLSEYFSEELVRRLDGLEVVSEIVSFNGFQVWGLNFSAAVGPFLALFPFFEEATQLKMDGMTSVKAYVLANEFGSAARDINSFVILDSYYLGGLVGVVFIGFAFGFLAKWVDSKIAIWSSHLTFIAMIAVATNLIILEREVLGILFSMIRDFIILIFFYFVIFSRTPMRTPKIN